MIYFSVIWLVLEILLAIYHIRKGDEIFEWNTLFIVFWIFCVFNEVVKINKLIGGT